MNLLGLAPSRPSISCSSPLGRSHLCPIGNFLPLVSALRWKITSAWRGRTRLSIPYQPPCRSAPLGGFGEGCLWVATSTVTGSASQTPAKTQNAPKGCPSERFWWLYLFRGRGSEPSLCYLDDYTSLVLSSPKPRWTYLSACKYSKKILSSNRKSEKFACVMKKFVYLQRKGKGLADR